MQTVATFKFYELGSCSISLNNAAKKQKQPKPNQNQYNKTTRWERVWGSRGSPRGVGWTFGFV